MEVSSETSRMAADAASREVVAESSMNQLGEGAGPRDQGRWKVSSVIVGKAGATANLDNPARDSLG